MFFERDLVRKRWAFNVGVEAEDRGREASVKDSEHLLLEDTDYVTYRLELCIVHP